eukprot:gene8115-12576_t
MNDDHDEHETPQFVPNPFDDLPLYEIKTSPEFKDKETHFQVEEIPQPLAPEFDETNISPQQKSIQETEHSHQHELQKYKDELNNSFTLNETPEKSNKKPNRQPKLHGNEICRNCHKQGGELIAPCKCVGSLRYVHRKCLNEWRMYSPNELSFSRCDNCHYGYKYEKMQSKKEYCHPYLKFFVFTGVDIGLVLFLWQILTFVIYGLVALIDWNGLRYKYIYPRWNWFLADYFNANVLFFYGFAHAIALLIVIKITVSCCDRFCGIFKYQKNYTYETYHYNPLMSTFDWFFIWYFWSIWYPMPGGSFGTEVCGFGNCEYCFCHPMELGVIPDCSGSFQSCDIGDIDFCKGCGEGAVVILPILIAIVLIIALIGFIIGMIFFIIFVITVVQKRVHYLKKKTEINTAMILDRDLEV